MPTNPRCENENSRSYHEASHSDLQTQDHTYAGERDACRGKHGQILSVRRQKIRHRQRQPQRPGPSTNPVADDPHLRHLTLPSLLWLSDFAGPKHGRAEEITREVVMSSKICPNQKETESLNVLRTAASPPFDELIFDQVSIGASPKAIRQAHRQLLLLAGCELPADSSNNQLSSYGGFQPLPDPRILREANQIIQAYYGRVVRPIQP